MIGPLALLAAVVASATPLPASSFAYPAGPPDIQVIKSTPFAAGTVRDVTFATADGKNRIGASLIQPLKSDGSAVLFVHWLGDDPKTTNRSEFLNDAEALAQSGTTSLLIDAPWAAAGWFEHTRKPETDYADSIRTVKDLRRALDVLTAQPGMDPSRLAFVGHDFGAMYGAVLSGVDPRPRFYTFMAGTTTFSQWFLLGAKPRDVDAYVASMAPLDPPGYVRASAARAYLVQLASKDEYITPAQARDFAAAVPAPKTVDFYDTNHALDVPAARADRVAWLRAHLAAK